MKLAAALGDRRGTTAVKHALRVLGAASRKVLAAPFKAAGAVIGTATAPLARWSAKVATKHPKLAKFLKATGVGAGHLVNAGGIVWNLWDWKTQAEAIKQAEADLKNIGPSDDPTGEMYREARLRLTQAKNSLRAAKFSAAVDAITLGGFNPAAPVLNVAGGVAQLVMGLGTAYINAQEAKLVEMENQWAREDEEFFTDAMVTMDRYVTPDISENADWAMKSEASLQELVDGARLGNLWDAAIRSWAEENPDKAQAIGIRGNDGSLDLGSAMLKQLDPRDIEQIKAYAQFDALYGNDEYGINSIAGQVNKRVEERDAWRQKQLEARNGM
jgi:hypothetical protein